MISAPDSVSWTWTTSIPPGATPAIANALAAAATLGESPRSSANAGLNTSNDPNGRDVSTADRRDTGLAVKLAARSAVVSTSATAPSAGEKRWLLSGGRRTSGPDHPSTM